MLLLLLLLGMQMMGMVVVRVMIPVAVVVATGDVRKRGCLREGLYVVVLIATSATVHPPAAAAIPIADTILRGRMGQTVRVPVSRLVPVRIVRWKGCGRAIAAAATPTTIHHARRLMVMMERVRTVLHRRNTDVPPHLARTFLVALHVRRNVVPSPRSQTRLSEHFRGFRTCSDYSGSCAHDRLQCTLHIHSQVILPSRKLTKHVQVCRYFQVLCYCSRIPAAEAPFITTLSPTTRATTSSPSSS